MRILLALALALTVSPAFASSKVSSKHSGRASWYECCKRTASGERFNPDGLTAAHRTLPFGSKVLVENVVNGKSVVVRINDRGPFVKSRLIDLSRGAARRIGLIGTGVGSVRIQVIE